MAFLRTKKIGDSRYFYWVESYRDEQGNPKQKILKYLGKDREAIIRAHQEQLPPSAVQKIKDAFTPGTTYIIFKVNSDSTIETYYRDWDDDFLERH